MKTSVGYWEKFMSQCVESELLTTWSISVDVCVGVCVGGVAWLTEARRNGVLRKPHLRREESNHV